MILKFILSSVDDDSSSFSANECAAVVGVGSTVVFDPPARVTLLKCILDFTCVHVQYLVVKIGMQLPQC